MSPRGRGASPGPGTGRRRVDVLYVSLGSTIGLRVADDQFVAALRSAGLQVETVRARPPREVRTLMLTDLLQARSVAAAVRDVLRRIDPARIIYSTTTAAMFWPQPGAIRFDALAQVTRPGRHGLWQRRLELRRLAQATLLIPEAEASLDGAPPAIAARPRVVVPIAIPELGDASLLAGMTVAPDRAHPASADVHAAVDAILEAVSDRGGRAVAITYAADVRKKGLDRVLAAWSAVRGPDEVLLVAGRDDLPGDPGEGGGVQLVGRLEPAVFRALMRAVGVLALAPRREDYGLVQLEALAEGARVVTTAAPGPYAALPLVRVLWPEQVVPNVDDPAPLGAALRHAIDARPDTDDLIRATVAVAPWRAAAVRETVERALIPALMRGA